MSSTVNDVERAQMMLSLGMNDAGEALSAEERETLEQFVAAHEQQSSVPPPEVPEESEGASAIQAMIQAELAKALGSGAGQSQSFEDMLKQVDPRDSEAALAMFNWLADNGRFQVIGNLNGGGYLLHYQEPKGASKQGYTPGGTQGGRMVDEAVQKAKDSGAKPRKTGLCSQCYSAVEQLDDGTIVTDDQTRDATCGIGGPHNFNA